MAEAYESYPALLLMKAWIPLQIIASGIRAGHPEIPPHLQELILVAEDELRDALKDYAELRDLLAHHAARKLPDAYTCEDDG